MFPTMRNGSAGALYGPRNCWYHASENSAGPCAEMTPPARTSASASTGVRMMSPHVAVVVAGRAIGDAAIFAECRFFDLRVAHQRQCPRRDLPRLLEHLGIFDNRLPLQGVALPRQPLGDLQVGGVEKPVVTKPGVFEDVSHVDDERVPFPAADGVAVSGR